VHNEGDLSDPPGTVPGMRQPSKVRLGGYPLSGMVRRVRRTADLSQRELASKIGLSPALIGAIETGDRTPSLGVLARILGAAGFHLEVVDRTGHLVLPLEVWQDTADGAGRRYPPHLDTILDPVFGEWWADGFGLARPPETFRRNRNRRDYERSLSQWEVRVQKYRNAPPPRPPLNRQDGDEYADDEGWG
jgi:transcriptional regulator with XRE-family HTH domain